MSQTVTNDVYSVIYLDDSSYFLIYHSLTLGDALITMSLTALIGVISFKWITDKLFEGRY